MIVLTKDEKRIFKRLTEKRQIHTMGVLEYGLELCDRWNGNAEKFRLAAVFHDLYRGISKEDLNPLVRKYGLDEKYLDNPSLAHGKLARIAMEREYGITDVEVLDAVDCHTTGRAGMTLLDKILFLADAGEKGRSYPGLETLRELAQKDLNAACAFSIRNTIRFVNEKGGWVDPESIQALEDLETKAKEPINL